MVLNHPHSCCYALIDGRAILCSWTKEAMGLVTAGVSLVIPGIRTVPGRSEKPQCIRSRANLFPINDTPGKTNVTVTGSLVKVPLLGSFKSAGTLKHHVIHEANSLKIQTIGKIRLTPTLPTMSIPCSPSPSASARISRASVLTSSKLTLITANVSPPYCSIIYRIVWYKCPMGDSDNEKNSPEIRDYPAVTYPYIKIKFAQFSLIFRAHKSFFASCRHLQPDSCL